MIQRRVTNKVSILQEPHWSLCLLDSDYARWLSIFRLYYTVYVSCLCVGWSVIHVDSSWSVLTYFLC